MSPVVIVGGGMAGYAAARALRQKSNDVPITLITDDEGIPYSKPALSTCFTTSRPVSALTEKISEADAKKLSINLLNHTAVHRICSKEMIVETEVGNIAYRSLILALGASPIALRHVEGLEHGRIHAVNDLNAYRRFREVLHSAHRVTIVGAGLVGCEFASDLRRGGFAVTVVDIADQPLSRLLPPLLAIKYQKKLSELGIEFRLGQSINRIASTMHGVELVLESKEHINSDVLLLAIGIQPRTELAKKSGLEVRRGIIVNRFLRTSVADIYALGDCSEYGKQTLPYIGPLRWGAEALAETILNREKEVIFPVMPVTVKTPDCPISVVVPPMDMIGEWQIENIGEGSQALFRDQAGSIRGFALLGEAVKKFRIIEKQIVHQSIWDIPS